jgi:hypothetical protein
MRLFAAREARLKLGSRDFVAQEIHRTSPRHIDKRLQTCHKSDPILWSYSAVKNNQGGRMRKFLAVSILGLSACAQVESEPPSARARFPTYPTDLLAAFESACSGPAQSFSTPAPDLVECREYLPPEPTAAIILGYNGTPEKLPQLVIRFRTQADDPGFVVENDVYLNVPQKAGQDIQVRQYDTRLHRTLSKLYEKSGGTPE